jgi:hypothetical protein
MRIAAVDLDLHCSLYERIAGGGKKERGMTAKYSSNG